MRMPVASWVLVACAVAASACASRRSAPCGPVCITEVRRAPTCCEVCLPERCETRLAYRPVAAECRTREMPEYGLCQRTIYEERRTPITSPVEVPDYCPTLVPTCERVCVPCLGYRTEQDYEDRVEPVCAPHRTPVFREVPVPVCGCVCDPCGCPTYGTIGTACVTRQVGTDCEMRKVGERLVQVNVGEHPEQVRTGVTTAPLITGSRPGRALVGHHVEQLVVGEQVDCVKSDFRIEVRQTGTRRESIVKRPCRLEAYEEQVRTPAMRVRVCDDPRHRHEGMVISSREYESLTGRTLP